jgi:hypothetical protein
VDEVVLIHAAAHEHALPLQHSGHRRRRPSGPAAGRWRTGPIAASRCCCRGRRRRCCCRCCSRLAGLARAVRLRRAPVHAVRRDGGGGHGGVVRCHRPRVNAGAAVRCRRRRLGRCRCCCLVVWRVVVVGVVLLVARVRVVVVMQAARAVVVARQREVAARGGAPYGACCCVVRARRLLGGVKRAEPPGVCVFRVCVCVCFGGWVLCVVHGDASVVSSGVRCMRVRHVQLQCGSRVQAPPADGLHPS